MSTSNRLRYEKMPSFLKRHQIIKIAACLFLEISAFFYLKLRVVGLCKKVLLEYLKRTAVNTCDRRRALGKLYKREAEKRVNMLKLGGLGQIACEIKNGVIY